MGSPRQPDTPQQLLDCLQGESHVVGRAHSGEGASYCLAPVLEELCLQPARKYCGRVGREAGRTWLPGPSASEIR